MLKQTLKKLHKDENGSAMVMVIIAIAFISILIATLFWVTMANFFMKYTDVRNKENFYSAETVFEEMKAGMQKRASDELLTVYTTAFGDYTNGTTEADIQDRYLTAIYDFYRTDPNHFNPEILIGYVDDLFHPYYDGVLGGAGTVPGGGGIPFRYEAAVITAGEIQKTDQEVILKNITVRFSDHDTGYYSEITSDLAVGLPNIRFTKSSELPAIFDYAIIADTGVKLENGTTLVMKKNLYSGKNGIAVGNGVSAGSAKGAKLDLRGAEYVVTKGTVSLNGMANSAANKSSIITGEATRLYAGDIDVRKGDGDLGGKTYVADDLIYNDVGNVTISGNYFGFGNSSVSADASSSILINAKNSELDLNSAKSVMLAGHSFIATSDDTDKLISDGLNAGYITVSKNSSDVLMGQSIAVKGDQVAYLIPGTCIGVWKSDNGTMDSKNNTILVGMNPVPDVTVSYNAYGQPEPYFATTRFLTEKFVGAAGHIETVDMETPVHALGGKPLSAYSSKYKVIYKTQNGQNLAYFYIVLNEDMANQYLKDYYAVKNQTLHNYYNYYTKDVVVDNTAGDKEISTAGHYLNGPDRKNLSLAGASSNSASQMQNSADIASTYKALCARLVTDGSGVKTEEYTRTLYENLIDETKMPGSGKTVVFKIGDGADMVRAVVTGDDFEYKSGMQDIHLIVSAGDVTVEADFDGIIIAKGTVTVKNGGGAETTVNMGGNRDAVIRLLQVNAKEIYPGSGLQGYDSSMSAPKDDVNRPCDYFKDGAQYVLEGTSVSSNKAADDDSLINFGELVRYENWAKK